MTREPMPWREVPAAALIAVLAVLGCIAAVATGADPHRLTVGKAEQRPHEFLVESKTTEEADGYVTTRRVWKYATPTGRWETFTTIIHEPGPNYVWPDGHRGRLP